jgi:polar amino acid transport system substrate-binding protein
VLLLAGGLLASSLTACGGSSQASNGYKLVTPGQLTFAMSGQYRPFNYFDKDGKLAGFDVDMGNEIAKKLGLKPNPVTGPFDSLVAGLSSKRYDVIIGSMSPTAARKKQVDFTKDYYDSGAQLFVKKDSSIASVSDLRNATVGVTLGTTFEAFAKTQPGVKSVRTYPSDNQALTELANGRLDAVITTKLLGLFQIKAAGVQVKQVGNILFPDPAAIASRKDNSTLTAKVNKILVELKSDGTYAKLSNKWFGVDISSAK